MILYVTTHNNDFLGMLEFEDETMDGYTIDEIAKALYDAGHQEFLVYESCSNCGPFSCIIDSNDYDF